MYKKEVSESKSINYFSVESISDFLAEIEKLGGKVINPNKNFQKLGG
jgi:predicted enzyme related to lactoylglutathione lyase